MFRKQITKIAVLLLISMGFSLSTQAQEQPPVDFYEVEWPTATPEDIHVFDPYIGKFKSTTQTTQSGKEIFFTIEYEWFDANQTMVKFTIITHIPEDGIERLNGEGYYVYDGFEERLVAYGFFPRGTMGTGALIDFDRDTFYRSNRLHSKRPDGSVMEIWDSFSVVDENTWTNKTFVSRDGGEWQLVFEDTYTRVN